MKIRVPEGTAADPCRKYVATPQASCLDAELREVHQGTTLQDMASGLLSAQHAVTDESGHAESTSASGCKCGKTWLAPCLLPDKSLMRASACPVRAHLSRCFAIEATISASHGFVCERVCCSSCSRCLWSRKNTLCARPAAGVYDELHSSSSSEKSVQPSGCCLFILKDSARCSSDTGT